MNQPHEWTESGRELLREIKLRIELNGGRDTLARDIEQEWKSPVSNHWTPHEVAILLKNRHDYGLVSRATGRTETAVHNKLRQIKELTKLKQLLFK